MNTENLKVLLTCLVLCFTIHILNAQILWYGDPNLSVNDNFRRLDPNGNSNPSGDDCVDDPNNPPAVTKPIDAQYGKFWRITKPVSRKRAEFARTTGDVNDFEPVKGETYYYGWRWRINSTPDPTGDVTVWQWKSDDGGNLNLNKQNYPLNMEYDGTVLTLKAFGPAEPNWTSGGIFSRRTTLWRQVVEENTWVSFVIKLKVDDTYDNVNNRYEGYVEFWFNGVQQTLNNLGSNLYEVVLANSDTRAYHKTFDGIVTYPKWGSYNEEACDLLTITDFDEMRVTSTYASALPNGSSGVDNPDIVEGTYKIKNLLTGNYMTYNSSDDNIFASNEVNDSSQEFDFIKTGGTSSGSDELFNVVSKTSGTVLRADNLNVYATTSTNAPSTSNPNSFIILEAGGGIYHLLANTSSLRYVGEVLDLNSNVHFTGGPWARTEWILELKQTLSSEGLSEDKIELYPNPVRDVLQLKMTSQAPASIKIYDLSGKLIEVLNSKNGVNEIPILTNQLKSGMYFLEILSDSNKTIKKFVKY